VTNNNNIVGISKAPIDIPHQANADTNPHSRVSKLDVTIPRAIPISLASLYFPSENVEAGTGECGARKEIYGWVVILLRIMGDQT
jgi:hypothetical protein